MFRPENLETTRRINNREWFSQLWYINSNLWALKMAASAKTQKKVDRPLTWENTVQIYEERVLEAVWNNLAAYNNIP